MHTSQVTLNQHFQHRRYSQRWGYTVWRSYSVPHDDSLVSSSAHFRGYLLSPDLAIFFGSYFLKRRRRLLVQTHGVPYHWPTRIRSDSRSEHHGVDGGGWKPRSLSLQFVLQDADLVASVIQCGLQNIDRLALQGCKMEGILQWKSSDGEQ